MAATRRLAAIMFTDMVGSTASAHADEAAALRLRDEQASLVRPLFSVHQGREIKSMGDGFLAEFDSALRAVECAIDIQHRLHERNSQPGAKPIQLRIGIHLGDVEQRENDIFGDAVNIASRIEPLAEPGGICLSGEVFSQIRNKVPNLLEKLPSTPLKGLPGSIDLYRVGLPWMRGEPSLESPRPAGIAVLPFSNISPDSKDEYFADGLTEELITVLSQLRGLRVIARTSVMPYRSTAKGVSQIGAELHVSSILEGSVRKAGNRLRVTAQLIDVGTESHLWAETYDRELDDIFAVQADLAKQVAEALKIRLRAAEESRLQMRASIRPESYVAYLKGLALARSTTEPSMRAAKEQFELAISLDDRNAAAYAGLCRVTEMYGLWHTDASHREWALVSRRAGARAIELDPNLAEAHAAVAILVWDELDWATAEKEFKTAISLNPSFSLAHTSYALFLEELGRPEEALLELTLAEGSDPLWDNPLLHHAYLLIYLGRFDEAFLKIEQMRPLSSEGRYHAVRLHYYLNQGDMDGCRKEALEAEATAETPINKSLARAWYLLASGQREECRAVLREQSTRAEHGQNASYMAEVYAVLGDPADLDECFRLLDQPVDRINLPFHPWRLDPKLEQVRRDPRFQALLRKVMLS